MELVTTAAIVVQAGGPGFIVMMERGRYSGGLHSTGGGSRCRFKWFCCRSSCWWGSPSRSCWGWPAARTRAITGKPAQGYRAAPAELARAGHPDRQMLQQSVRAPAVLFYVLIAIALPLRRTDLVIVLLSWLFVVTRFVHAGIFVTSNDLNRRSLAWFAGVLVVFAMGVYFALKILLLI